MSSRIMVDAGPGENLPPRDPEPQDQQRSPPEPVEARESIPAPEPVETDSAHHEPADAPADASQREAELAPEVQQRIDRLTRERYEARRERDEMRQQYAEWQRQQSQAQQPRGSDDYERGLRAAQEQRVIETFNEACNNLYRRGRDEYGAEMDEAVSALNAVGWGNRPDALAAVTRLPDAHRVYRQLAGNLDNAARVLSLPLVDMVYELTRMSNGAAPAPSVPAEREAAPVTRAPEPIRPIGGNSRQSERPLDHPQTSMAEFIRRRDRDERRSRISR